MENKNKTIKIRISEKELNMLEQCSELLGISKSETIRLGIEEVYNKNKKDDNENMKEKMYIETIERKDIGYYDQSIWTKTELIEILSHQIPDGIMGNRKENAKNLIEQLHRDGSLEMGSLYISKYREATKEEIAAELTKRIKEKEYYKNLKTPLITAIVESCQDDKKN